MTGIFCKFLAPAAYSKKELRETQHIAAADAVNVGVSSLFGIELKENYRKHSNGAPYIQGYDDIFSVYILTFLPLRRYPTVGRY